jgi:hypothetical protein
MQAINLTILIVVISGISPSLSAEPRRNECSGILHVDHGSIQFGGRLGESEGLCIIANSEQSKVLAVCAIDQFCRVSGRLSACKDSGECSEIRRVYRAQKH